MKIFRLNGQFYTTFDQFTLSDLIIYFGYDSSVLVVEYNKFICPKSKWTEMFITNNDNIEIISIVGGG
jgi:thiamine biosynthesis protein ThiS